MININILGYEFSNFSKGNKNYLKGSKKKENYKYAPKKPGVYILKCDNSGSFYIGNTKDLSRRISHHLGSLKRNVHHCYRLQELFNKSDSMTLSFSYVLIDSEEERSILENNLLKKYHNDKKLLNTITIDGSWSTERNTQIVVPYIEKISKIASKRTGEKNPFYGKTHSKETKRALSEAMTGKSNPGSWKAIVINGVLYKNLDEASESTGVNARTLSHRALNNSIIYCNYYYLEDHDKVEVVDSRFLFDPKRKTISRVYEIEGSIYFNSHDVAKEYDIHRATVSWRCKSKNDKYKNWNIIAK